MEVMHGDDGPGQIVGRAAMERAIELAKTYNIGMVGAIRSNHFGAAATYHPYGRRRGYDRYSHDQCSPKCGRSWREQTSHWQ